MRRGVAGARRRASSSFLAGVLVEGDDRRALGADVDEHLVIDDDRRAGAAERQRGGAVHFRGIDLPEDLVGRGVEAGEDAGDAEGVDLAIDDARGAARAVAEGDFRFDARIRRAPGRLAGGGVEDGEDLLVLAGRAGVQIDFAAWRRRGRRGLRRRVASRGSSAAPSTA